MNKSSIKSLSLSGSLTDGSLLYTLAKNELSEGIWQLSVRDFGYSVKRNNTSQFVQISCNLIKDLREKDYVLQNYMPVIASAKIEGQAGQKQIVYFEPVWFRVTTPEKNIALYFRNPFSDEQIKLNCDLFVTLLLQRIQ